MFYSQTFLARKGPLGTVWCAAHLQHRLKKSHYTSTDIPSTVDRIIYPEVPIALRMYSHLLLGVVRIYSKKVDYLFHDCNIILIGLRKVFATAQVDLPEDARQAPVQAVTLPETFDLDAMQIDVEISVDGPLDNHLSSQDDITLTDQIPIGRDPYVAITFDDDIMMDAAPPGEIHTSSIPREPPEDRHVDVQDPGTGNPIDLPRASAPSQDTSPSNQMHERDYGSPSPSNQSGAPMFVSNDSPQSIEVRRDAPRDLSPENPFLVHPDIRHDPTEVTGSRQQVGNEKETNSPSSNTVPSEGPSMPFREHSDPPTSAASKGLPEVSFGYSSPQLVIQPSPPVQQPVQQARQRRVRQKRFFDEELVLPNRLMKRALEDHSDLVKKRRKVPCSALGVWKLNNSRRMEHVFNEPSLTGSCAAISNMFNREYISTKPHLVLPEEVVPEPHLVAPEEVVPEPHLVAPEEVVPEPHLVAPEEVVPEPHLVVPEEVVPEPTVPQSTTPMTEAYREIQHLRHNESNIADNVHPQLSSPARSMPSQSRTDDSPSSINSLESELGPNAEFSAIPEFGGSEMDTPGFSAIPGFESSEADLKFLEEDDGTPTESQASKGVDSLSQRTRQVAKYLKMHSPITPISEDLYGDLSLNKILEGKRRKICARMFYETLVLKSHDLVDVQQEEPYGDIILKLTPTLSKSQI